MLVYAVICFAITAVGGLILAASVLRGRLAPWALSLVHALLGATGLMLVLVGIAQGAHGYVTGALILLLVAALGGFYLASYHLQGQPGPKAAVIAHAAVAVAGFLLLAGTAFRLV